MYTAGVLLLAAAAFVWATAATGLHELVAVALLGFGVLSLGIGGIIERMPKR